MADTLREAIARLEKMDVSVSDLRFAITAMRATLSAPPEQEPPSDQPVITKEEFRSLLLELRDLKPMESDGWADDKLVKARAAVMHFTKLAMDAIAADAAIEGEKK